MLESIIVRLILSLLLGALIGAERSFIGKQAGLRTFALVSMGACLFTYLGLSLEPSNPSRVLSNLVVGVSFLGAGIIFVHQERVVGLTTAASLWTTTAIGAAVGMGYVKEAIFVTILTLAILWLLVYVEKLIRRSDDEQRG
ncbi:MAG: MgtC/SapB family protein [Patescibacteria group bacterium]|nr:MgtC/SapB family protein [Patescibacteria group bacterium]